MGPAYGLELGHIRRVWEETVDSLLVSETSQEDSVKSTPRNTHKRAKKGNEDTQEISGQQTARQIESHTRITFRLPRRVGDEELTVELPTQAP